MLEDTSLTASLLRRIPGDEAWMTASSYWKPEHLIDSAWHEHAPFAYWIVDAVRPRSIVELGTHFGFSYFVFCEAIARLGLETSAFALDTWEGDDHAGFYSEEVFDRVSQLNERDYRSFSRMLRGYFDDSLDKIPDGSVDLLHIDGRHGLEDVRHDFQAWLPKVSKGGVVLFHDVAEHHPGFGVWQFWEEISSQYPSFAFEHGHGLGVLAVGSDVPIAMQRFLDAAAQRPVEVRRTYETLGRQVSAQFAVETALAAAEARVSALETALGEAQLSCALTQSHGEALAREVTSLQHEVEAIRSSTSWRVTRPLRAVKNTLRRS